MAENWKKYLLLDVATLQRGFDLPSDKRVNGNIPIIAASGTAGYHNCSKVKGPGVVTGRSGTIGKVMYEENDFWPLNTSLWVKDFHGNNPRFIYYLFHSIDFLIFNTGTSVPTLNRNDIHKLSVKIPPLPEQQAIAEILSALDDKIELNLQMNKTLEEMAMTLYKHWFIDFGPFQDGEFVESELGRIPKGWEVYNLDEVCHKKSKTFDFHGKEDVIFINTGDVHNGEFLHSNRMLVSDLPGQAKKIIKKDDILYSEIRPKNKRFAYVNFDSRDYVVSTKFMIIKAKDKILNRLLYRILIREETIFEFNSIAESRSGTFPQITFDAISKFKIALPEVKTQDLFMAEVRELEGLQESVLKEIQYLIQTRDTLLPKLISGEIRVKQAEEMVSNVL